MKKYLIKLDLVAQASVLLFFLICMFTGDSTFKSYLLLNFFIIASIQLLSAAIWGIAFSDYSRGQFFIVAVLAVFAFGFFESFPETKGSYVSQLFGIATALVMIIFYFIRTLRDAFKGYSFHIQKRHSSR